MQSIFFRLRSSRSQLQGNRRPFRGRSAWLMSGSDSEKPTGRWSFSAKKTRSGLMTGRIFFKSSSPSASVAGTNPQLSAQAWLKRPMTMPISRSA